MSKGVTAWDLTAAWGNVSAPVSSNDPLERIVLADAYLSDGGFAPRDDGFAQTFSASVAPPTLRSLAEREKREFREHRRRSRARRIREVTGEVVDALSLGTAPLYRAAKREWASEDEYFMGLRQEPSMFRRGVQAIKRLVTGRSGESAYASPVEEVPISLGVRSLARESRYADAAPVVAPKLELIADHEVPEGLMERLAGSDVLASEASVFEEAPTPGDVYAASFDPQAIGDAYVSSTLRGRTLNKSAMRAVEAKRGRLETFARTYADTGSVEHAAEAVGITTARTIADYVRRTGVSEGSGGSENRSDDNPFDSFSEEKPQSNYN